MIKFEQIQFKTHMKIRRWFTFNLWYYREPPWDTGISPPELLDYIHDHPPGRALDLGCGTGTNVITLAQHGWDVIGIDYVRRAIKTAQRKSRRAGVNIDLRVGDVTHPDENIGPFDLVLDIGCFISLSDSGKSDYIHNLNRLLAPDGNYLMYGFFKTPDKKGPGLDEKDLERLSECLQLLKRVDGTERNIRHSVWMTYQK